uniref:Uncharacterized protein n=1 Tax=Thermofilum pendens TaxID=2269 RepID=A0A7C4BAR2_THEPE
MLDVAASTKEAMEKFINFVASVTEGPIFNRLSSAEVRTAGIKYAKEVGLEKRVVNDACLIGKTLLYLFHRLL